MASGIFLKRSASTLYLYSTTVRASTIALIDMDKTLETIAKCKLILLNS